ncbi:hypothetical protein [Sphingobacterium athyrii]|uniref:Uncharacterized protein n=1 Tax=Sphingobacterium athyrii TaxID=2152717 RepID=A0A363NQ19_9SPHI|nr:hypothetical protein [Sphingobacterium athyrii]PUV22761.1 hypothetical protein DCO56_21450 [Sphingobacterium athyrii]
MNQKYIPVLPLEIAFYEINDKGYDPLKVIRDFWANYHINDCYDNIELVIEKYKYVVEVPNVFDANKKHTFFLDLLRLLVAYYQVHSHAIKLDDIGFSCFKVSEHYKEDLKITKRIHDFFGPAVNLP